MRFVIRLLRSAWRRLDLVADDPGVETDWIPARYARADEPTAAEPAPAARRKAPRARPPILS